MLLKPHSQTRTQNIYMFLKHTFLSHNFYFSVLKEEGEGDDKRRTFPMNCATSCLLTIFPNVVFPLLQNILYINILIVI